MDGELRLPVTRALAEDFNVKLDIEELRFRSDAPARLTGNYLARFTVPGLEGSVLLGLRLEVVTRIATATAQSRSTGYNGSLGNRRDLLQRRLALRAGVYP